MNPGAVLIQRQHEDQLKTRCEILMNLLIMANGTTDPVYIQMEQAIASNNHNKMTRAVEAYYRLPAGVRAQIEGTNGICGTD